MSTRVMPYRGSLTSREQIAVYEFSWPALIFIPLVALLIQIFIPVKVRYFPIIDLPFMVTIFFAVARRNPVSGCLTGCVIGLMQDLFAGPNHPLGMYGIALTIIGYLASSLGVKIDTDYIHFLCPAPGDLLRCGAWPAPADADVGLEPRGNFGAGQRGDWIARLRVSGQVQGAVEAFFPQITCSFRPARLRPIKLQ